MTCLKKERRANLKKEEERSYKVTLNALIMVSRGIMLRIVTRNRSRMEEPEPKPKF
jgi:hypothetical protein